MIFKTVLRDMRKYYKSEFNSQTLYISRKRKKRPTYFRKILVKYIDQNLAHYTSQPAVHPDPRLTSTSSFSLHTALGSILYPKDMKALLRAEGIPAASAEYSGTELLSSVMLKFSHQKLADLTAHPHFAFLYSRYYERGVR